MPTPAFSVVIPALNEARNLPYVFARIPPHVHEVILVEGRSTDGNAEIAREVRPDLRIVTQTRHGRRNAHARRFAATGDMIATMDADGSADPERCHLQYRLSLESIPQRVVQPPAIAAAASGRLGAGQK